MPDERITAHDAHPVRIVELDRRATLWLLKGAQDWKIRGAFDPDDPDDPIPDGNYTLEMIATGARHRFEITRDGDTYRLIPWTVFE